MWFVSKRDFREFRAENRQQHKEVADGLSLLHGRINRQGRWFVRVVLTAAGTFILMLVSALAWLVGRYFDTLGGTPGL